MDNHASTFEYSTSTTQENMSLPEGFIAQPHYDSWGSGFYSQLMQDQMEWLSANNAQYGPSQDYLACLHNSYSDSTGNNNQCNGLMPRQPSQADIALPSLHPSSTSPAPTHNRFDGRMLSDSSSEARPPSAGTMVNSNSSNESRQSSLSTSPMSRALKIKVPKVTTQFDSSGQVAGLDTTPIGDGIQVAPDTDGMTAMSNEWMHVHDTSDQYSLHNGALSAVSMKPSPALLEPFQWHNSVSRRTSMSSAMSGPMFSPFGTPTSAVWQQAAISPSRSWASATGSGRVPASPQSPYNQRNYGSWNSRQLLQARQQMKHLKPSANSLPSRNKPRLYRNVSDSYALAAPQTLPSQSRTRPNEGRRARAETTSYPPSTTPQQMRLPEFHLSTLFTTPDMSQAEFAATAGMHTPPRSILPSSATQTPMAPPASTPRAHMTPNFNSLHLSTPYNCAQPFPTLPTNAYPTTCNMSSIPTPAHQPPLPTPSEPPLSDFLVSSTPSKGSSSSPNHNHVSACGPIRQSPHFEGDIYTPLFKRRNVAGKWEGWCGYCQPGRWLDLKNSRYWEDKLRNHGICARTKTFFEGPLRVRWVSDRGTVWEGEPGDGGFDVHGREGVDDDGVGRKREGLCGECNKWVGMDGMRSRGKGRCVAWWMHAYKCHEQSKSKTEGSGNI